MSEVGKPIGSVYRGGVRWRKINWSWPLAALSMSSDGITIRPATRWTFGKPRLDLAWSEIGKIEAVRGALPFSFGVSFAVGSRRLIWWAGTSPEHAENVIAAARGFAPEKVEMRSKLKLVF
jgi:hypothetical protein